MIARSLQVRLLAVLVLAVGIALGTVAVVARASTTAEFTRYVEGNRVEMQAVAREIAASVGDRLLVTNQQGRVIIDSSEELVGRTLTPDQVQKLGPLHAQAPPPSRADLDVLFVRRGIDSALEGPIWTRSVPPGSPVLPMLGLDPAQPNAQARDGIRWRPTTASRSSLARSRVLCWSGCWSVAASPSRSGWRSRAGFFDRSAR